MKSESIGTAKLKQFFFTWHDIGQVVNNSYQLIFWVCYMTVTVLSKLHYFLLNFFIYGSMVQQSEGTTPGSSSTVGSVMKTSGQQQVCVSQATVGSCKAPAPSVISATSLVSTPNPISGKATVSGWLYHHFVSLSLLWSRIFLEGLKPPPNFV